MIKQLRLPVIAFTALLLGACGQERPAVEPAPAVRVATVAATADSGYRAESSYTGRVEARLDSQLGFEIGGLLAAVTVDEGSVVDRGDALAKLDTARLDAQRAEAKAAVEQVEAELELAVATLARTEEAFSYKGVSQQALDESRQQVAALEAAAGVARARLDRIEVDIAKATLRAPFAGTVVRRASDPGAVLSPGQPMVALQSTERPEARIGVSPDAAAALVAGDRYTLSINNRPVEATLKTIVPRRDEATRTIDVIFTLDGQRAGVRPGDLARLETERFVSTPGYWVPVSALIEGPRGLWQSLVAEAAEDGYVLVKHTLEILHADERRAFVRGTLESGDLLVSEGTHRVVAGQRVDIGGGSRLATAAGASD